MIQYDALEILKTGRNVFLTGPAGSGKTHVLNSYIKYLKSNSVEVAVTASTGIAATHLGGQTIHSWSGLGIRSTLTERDIDDLIQKKYLYKKFEKTKVLIIDEISMLSDNRLDMVEWICRRMKYNERAFGGMQIVMSGDFFQLPPINRFDQGREEFGYKGESWSRANLTVCYLTEQHRQKDNTYLSILNQIRQNAVTEKTVDLLKTRLDAHTDGEVESTRLYTHNVDVDAVNKKHLDLIEGQVRSYRMTSRGSANIVSTLKKSCLSPEILELKKGAKVMFTKNHPEGAYVNGTLGIISDFNSFGDPVVKMNSGMHFSVMPQSWRIEEEGKVKAEINQLPLRLAWAITVHKSQGMSLDAMEVDLSKSFVCGMGYVALSRVRSLSGMKLLGFNDMSLEVDGEVLAHDLQFQRMSDDALAVLVQTTREDILQAQKTYLEASRSKGSTQSSEKKTKSKKKSFFWKSRRKAEFY